MTRERSGGRVTVVEVSFGDDRALIRGSVRIRIIERGLRVWLNRTHGLRDQTEEFYRGFRGSSNVPASFIRTVLACGNGDISQWGAERGARDWVNPSIVVEIIVRVNGFVIACRVLCVR